MNFFKLVKSHFTFTRGEQSGILFLSLLIVGIWGLNWGTNNESSEIFDVESQEVVAFQKEMDSLYEESIQRSKPKLYPFNPNFISDYKAYVLGLSPEQLDALRIFREQGKWINSAKEFQKITNVDDLWLDSISPYFKFPIWKNSKNTQKPHFDTRSISFTEKTDLNKATQLELMQVRGIGEVYSRRILDFRNRLGGFSDDVQLYFVYGIKEEIVDELLHRFAVKTPKPISKKNINLLSASDLSTLPGITFELAVMIWEFIQKKNGIESLDELRKIDEITPQKIALIQLYLSAEPGADGFH